MHAHIQLFTLDNWETLYTDSGGHCTNHTNKCQILAETRLQRRDKDRAFLEEVTAALELQGGEQGLHT